MSIDSSVNDFLTAGGAPNGFPKDTPFDTVVRGVVESAEVRQQIDLSTGEPKFWKDGKPMNQLVVTLATDQRDDANSEDDGRRRLFAKGNMLVAIREAVRKSGGKLEVGGKLAVKLTGEDPPTQKGWNPAKTYTAQYEAPAPPAISTDDLL